MAEELLDQVRIIAEGQIVRIQAYRHMLPRPPRINSLRLQDFEGQKLAETLSTALLSIVGVSKGNTLLAVRTARN